MRRKRDRRASCLAVFAVAGAMLIPWNPVRIGPPAPVFAPRRVVVTSPFGYRRDPYRRGRRMHEGVDLGSQYGESVVAAADGLVVQARDTADGRGICVRLLHPDGRMTVYAHLADTAGAMLLSWVRAGQLIGHVGSTGRTTGPHLHFELREAGGACADPMPLVHGVYLNIEIPPIIRVPVERRSARARRAPAASSR